MAKMKVYELAKELDVQSKDVVAYLTENGSAVKSHASNIEDKEIDMVRSKFGKKTSAPTEKPAVKSVEKTENNAPAQAAPAASAPTAAPAQAAAPAAGGGTGVKSPLPGVILDIKVNVGDEVKKGQLVVVLEAMKMENSINADRDGKITAIKVNKGDSVLEGTDLVMIG